MGIIEYFTKSSTAAIAARGLGYGLVIAAVIAFFVTGTSRKVVRAIIRAGAVTRDTAKTAEELGLRGPFVRFSLRDSSPLRKTVSAVAPVGNDETRYFIPADGADRAEFRYVKKSSPATWIIGIVLLVGATEGAARLLPWLLGLVG